MGKNLDPKNQKSDTAGENHGVSYQHKEVGENPDVLNKR